MTANLIERYYRSNPLWVDGTTEFHELVCSEGKPSKKRVLELGAGPENRTTEYLSKHATVLHGLDVDAAIKTNKFLQASFLYDGRKFPLQEESYDLVVADYVMEHVEYPVDVLREINRILRPNGRFIFRTPNLWHYVALISFLTPHSFHMLVANRARQRPKETSEPYKTFYRFNTRRNIQDLSEKSGSRVVSLGMVEKEPSYGKFNSMAFRLGVAYERVVNKCEFLSDLRSNIFGVLEKSA